MGAVIGDLLPLAVGVAVSPIPIIAAILMLLSKRAGTTSVGFAIGWLAGIVVATTIFVALAGTISSSDGPSTTSSLIKIVLGVLLLAVGVRQWRGRTGEHATPKWMTAIDDLTAAKGFGLAFALAAINPKNLLMCVAAGVTIGGASLSVGQQVGAVAVFTVIAASTVAIPVIGYLVAAQRLRAPLDALKQWLQTNNATVMAVLILVIGIVLIGKGIGGL
ncbi:Sap-like sulfolipid-1-addressing protein [Williamsia limnetica]|uniref:Sap-like sulfolipid-1-addressing protein n=1 Tax=Williamsia limnetica TaxID=882452 RepID=A0A318S273_WILLI|nr:GAP family protein [Williamsia limnetica]PYE17488.1 Sap-like sulfolipid-1-addressing protein [Williamsia limnetica]